MNLQYAIPGQSSALGQAGIRGAVYNDAPPAMPPDTIMTDALRATRGTTDAIASACNRLEELRVRLFGHEPQAGSSKDAATPIPQGAVYELTQEFIAHQMLVNRLMGVITDLERIA